MGCFRPIGGRGRGVFRGFQAPPTAGLPARPREYCLDDTREFAAFPPGKACLGSNHAARVRRASKGPVMTGTTIVPADRRGGASGETAHDRLYLLPRVHKVFDRQ